MTERIILPGTPVRYRRNNEDKHGTVVAIEKCYKRGDICGERVRALAWKDRDLGFLTLDNGYCYGTELL